MIQVRHKLRGGWDGDPVEALRAAVAPIVAAPFVGYLLALEFAILYYALFSWRSKPEVPPGARAFTLHRRGGQQDLLFAAAIGALFEIVPVHLLLHRWSPPWAWVATAVSLDSAVWLVGLARSLELRPVLIGPDYLDLRYGLLFRLRASRETIAEVRRVKDGDAQQLVLPRRAEPNLRLEFAAPVAAERLFGRRRDLKSVAVAAYDEVAFETAVVQLMLR